MFLMWQGHHCIPELSRHKGEFMFRCADWKDFGRRLTHAGVHEYILSVFALGRLWGHVLEYGSMMRKQFLAHRVHPVLYRFAQNNLNHCGQGAGKPGSM